MSAQQLLAPEYTTAPLVRAGFEKLFAVLTGQRVISPLDAAYEKWRAAQIAYNQAKNDRDTRRMNACGRDLREARSACLRMELGR